MTIELVKEISFSIDQAKEWDSQLSSIMDASYTGIIKIDSQNRILLVNQFMKDELGTSLSEYANRPARDLLPGINEDGIRQVLAGETDLFSTSIRLDGTPFAVNITPTKAHSEICGAVILLHKVFSPPVMDVKEKAAKYQHQYTANYDFSYFDTHAAQLSQQVEEAKLYTLSNSPVLLYGEAGTETAILAQCIHSHSHCYGGPFVAIDCDVCCPEQHVETFWPRNGRSIFEKANHGTLYIKSIEKLSKEGQYRLYEFLQSSSSYRESNACSQFNIKIIASASADLAYFVNRQAFRQDLYYQLCAMTVSVPPLRRRREDLRGYITDFIKKYTGAYSKLVRLTDPAMDVLLNAGWPGNLIQLEKFCERIVISVHKRTITDSFAEKLLQELYPSVIDSRFGERLTVFKSPEAAQIASLLNQYHGNRSAVAKELGISPTTLWRKMKKYEIGTGYSID